jgi:hypothetical protein
LNNGEPPGSSRRPAGSTIKTVPFSPRLFKPGAIFV